MKYDDRPLWEQSMLYSNVKMEDQEPKRPNIPWADKVKNGTKSGAPSALVSWYVTENEKRLQKRDNEIDIQDIKNALQGFKNNWSPTIAKHPEVFEKFRESQTYDWKQIRGLRHD